MNTYGGVICVRTLVATARSRRALEIPPQETRYTLLICALGFSPSLEEMIRMLKLMLPVGMAMPEMEPMKISKNISSQNGQNDESAGDNT
ncbi:Hypothetical protein NTJ_11328 [Nesidiocoris tenuis]|uniref:Uncharacterized protein n=1 Tax=Nesidiocoris tenuis TaxID=355587 RepID=A0ABN7B273_9HEMI|nr:Hypothetical protein NTJ_11328 [Nesidiocoris tenuis]